jgi:hypothetical protein
MGQSRYCRRWRRPGRGCRRPHQICPFHAPREAGRLLYERDRAIEVQLRAVRQTRIRNVRRQLDRRVAAGPDGSAGAGDAPYARILADYAAGIQALINRDGLQPFRFGAIAMDDALGEVEQSLARLAEGAEGAEGAKGGEPSPPGAPTA